jgi:LDH2 family malate/lactate/ureidoglycolate dehydrogenase
MRIFRSLELVDLGAKILVAAGVPQSTATEVVESLVLSNLIGVDSHGVVRITQYVNALKSGAIVPDAEPVVVRENDVIVLLDGSKGFGQIVSKKAMRLAIDKARGNGVGIACYTNVYHIGRLGEYVAQAAEEGLIGILFTNGSRPGGLVAPFGARQRLLGTNPIAFAVPANSYPPLLADFATSAVAEGKIRIAHHKGEKVPYGLLLDTEGKPTEEPGDLYDGGAILTFGDHKGYALSLLVEVLGGILSGGDTPIFPNYKVLNNGVFALVIEPGHFRPRASYGNAVDYLFKMVKQALPAQGKPGALIPGEPEILCKKLREKEGIPVDDNTWAQISETAASLGITLEQSGTIQT